MWLVASAEVEVVSREQRSHECSLEALRRPRWELSRSRLKEAAVGLGTAFCCSRGRMHGKARVCLGPRSQCRRTDENLDCGILREKF